MITVLVNTASLLIPRAEINGFLEWENILCINTFKQTNDFIAYRHVHWLIIFWFLIFRNKRICIYVYIKIMSLTFYCQYRNRIFPGNYILLYSVRLIKAPRRKLLFFPEAFVKLIYKFRIFPENTSAAFSLIF